MTGHATAAEMVTAWLAEVPRDQLDRIATFALDYLAGALDDSAGGATLEDFETALAASLRRVIR